MCISTIITLSVPIVGRSLPLKGIPPLLRHRVGQEAIENELNCACWWACSGSLVPIPFPHSLPTANRKPVHHAETYGLVETWGTCVH